MGYNIAAYIEQKNDDGTWTLARKDPIASSLKYILGDEARDGKRIQWDDLSDGLKEIFKKDENGNVYAGFTVLTIGEMETALNASIKETFTKLNTIVQALGCNKIYNDDGEEMDWGDDEDERKKNPLTFPVNKSLIEDIQDGYIKMREIGQKETIDLIFNDAMEYGKEYRIILATI